uniref:Anaphase-promoting complex subunit 10 n=1 Tax=Chromera velia CCMP2878 TaxID=1169474 RepID=A0A0G4FIS2_9ALVE|mmetsp:Transcript_1967/g.4140  ORF Transcript_1967/g.4140 Transcript_1967/m.4140 type:complete len:206 (+) Transcript_1967:496-1113(+)|eukprot:Cvel_17071.t1-p1 / transcript=Cvel_17071.t1 / gene=Cvel_17071 / organism=Chromera_velia_CCMP2878 / gene_product=Anaphase-promoting complex subunit 10, putative / transcript_product=Anaphase-promoting complex subunit 10, putative / location=Cvel_scaffold1345:43663-46967(+) / protein_length=205 / sequence_SO=supercontig / SO=protein_coding / is_pseudo=false
MSGTAVSTSEKAPINSQDMIELGDFAVWSLSSAKPGNGVEQLRDGNTGTFWQSDGPQPHLVDIQFPHLTDVSKIDINVSHNIDESYTPQTLSVRAGTCADNLQPLGKTIELKKPEGWTTIPVRPPRTDPRKAQSEAEVEGGQAEFVSCFFLQLAILNNHQNGRDTHLRQVKVWGPKKNCLTVIPRTVKEAVGALRPEVLTMASVR